MTDGRKLNVLVFGATGGTGRRLVEQALQQGHVVTAFARDPKKIRLKHDNLRVFQGDVLLPDSVEAAISGQEAVVSALGIRIPVTILLLIVIASQIVVRTVALPWPAALCVELGVPILAILLLSRRKTTLSEGTRNIVRAMERAGVKRFVCESSLGVGDSKGKLGVFANLIAIPLFLRNIFVDKEEQERIIAGSNLDWVIVRPSALTNGPQRNVFRVGSDVGHWIFPSKISRADVAAFMLDQLTDGKYLRKTPGLSY